jgi:hypothetical protein
MDEWFKVGKPTGNLVKTRIMQSDWLFVGEMSCCRGRKLWIYCSASDCGGMDVDHKQRPGSQRLPNADDMMCCADAVITAESCISVLKPSGYFVKHQVFH